MVFVIVFVFVFVIGLLFVCLFVSSHLFDGHCLKGHKSEGLLSDIQNKKVCYSASEWVIRSPIDQSDSRQDS